MKKLALKREKLSMKKWIKGAGLLLITLMITASFAGCGNDSTKDDAGTTNDSQADTTHLNFGVYNYSDSLDPATNTNSSWAAMRFGITESLFIFNDQVVAENNLCDSYEVSDDYLTWTLHIRDGVKFSNGNDMTPSAVKASIERLYAETDASQGGTGNSNPESYLTYKSISADDAAGTVTIVCENPTSNIPGILAYPYFAIIDASVADKEIVGTGPYKVDKFNPGVNIDMSSNERYWNGKVPYKTVNIMFIDDSSTKTMALKSGDIDLTENITTVSDLATLSEDSAYYVSTAAGVRTANSYMNFKGVLENEALRQAIIIALDIDTMCDITVGGMYTPGFSVLPSSLAYNYDKLNNPFSFNKENAIKILDDAGIVDSNGDGWRELDGQNIDLDSVTFTSRNLNEFAEASALLLKEIGIKVTVNIRDYDTALALLNAGEFDLWTCNTLTVGVGDPQDYLSNWYSKNSRNFGYYSSSEYDAAFEELMIEMDDNRRLELITELQQILIDDAATIVYGYYNSRMFSDISKVTGADIATIDYYWLTTDIKPAR